MPAVAAVVAQLELQNQGDIQEGMARLRRLIGPNVHPDRLTAFVVEGAPVSKARARWSKGRTYTPQRTADAQEFVAWHFKKAIPEPLTGSIAIVAIFYRPNYQRIDADNLMKLIMDAATKAGVWVDDCYVTAQAAFIEMDHANPRTVIALCPTASSLDRLRQFTCQICHKEFRRAGLATFKQPPQFCSRECRSAGYRKDRQMARCPKCDREFQRKKSGQRYCSRACGRSSPLVRQPNASQRPAATCQVCGGRVSRREYLRCAKCSPKGRKIGSKNRATPGVLVTVEPIGGKK